MRSRWIGVVYDTVSLTVRSVINPDVDQELNDPAHTLNNHPQLAMHRIPRGEYEDLVHHQVAHIIAYVEAKLQGKPIGQTRTSRCASSWSPGSNSVESVGNGASGSAGANGNGGGYD